MSTDDIAMYVDLSDCKVKGILAHFKQTEEVKGSKCLSPKLYQTLCDYNIEVCN
jgi:hypothetical protein